MFEKVIHTLNDKHAILKDVLIALVLIFFTWLILTLLKKTIYKSSKIDEGRKYAFFQITKYFVIVIAAASVFQTFGINVTVIIASSAALLVGLGMGIQHLFNDFVSGFIILMDGTVKVGDIIELEGMISKVKIINLRTTTVETRGDKNIIIPNSTLTNKNLINWTHSAITSRFDINVGVDYNSDVKSVIKILTDVALANSDVLKTPAPVTRLVEFADSSLNFTLFFWTNEVFRVEQLKSDIRVAIFEEFLKHNISIPFPNRTVHIKNV